VFLFFRPDNDPEKETDAEYFPDMSDSDFVRKYKALMDKGKRGQSQAGAPDAAGTGKDSDRNE